MRSDYWPQLKLLRKLELSRQILETIIFLSLMRSLPYLIFSSVQLVMLEISCGVPWPGKVFPVLNKREIYNWSFLHSCALSFDFILVLNITNIFLYCKTDTKFSGNQIYSTKMQQIIQ